MLNAVWDVTSKCNLRCSHCYNADKYFSKNCDDLNDSEINYLLNFLVENGYKRLNLLGGEPFCHPKIYEIMSFCKKNKIELSITTNGTMFDDKLINYIVEKSSIRNLIVSIDGSDKATNDLIRGKGSFDKATKGIRDIIKAMGNSTRELSISISHCVFALNINKLFSMIDLCKKLNVNTLLLTPLINSGNAMNKWDLYKEDTFSLFDKIEETVQYAYSIFPSLIMQIDARPLVIWYLRKKYPLLTKYSLAHTKCQVLDKLLYIQANGELHPCGFHTFESGLAAQNKGYFNSNDTFKITTVSDLKEIRNSKYYSDFISSMKKIKKKNYHEYCKICPVKNDCYPCPFQFENGVIECDWAQNKILKFQEEIRKSIIISKENISEKHLVSSLERKIYNILVKGDSLWESYKLVLSSTNLDLQFFDFIDIIRSFERRFFLVVE